MGCVNVKKRLNKVKVETNFEEYEEEDESEVIIEKLTLNNGRKFFKLFAIQEAESIKENSMSSIY